MPLVVPGVTRFAFNQSLGDQDVVNVLDMQIDTTGSIYSRSEGIFEVAGDLINNWLDHISPEGATALILDSVSWVDLDSANGDVGVRTSTSEHTLPKSNGSGTNSFPGNVAILVTKQAGGTRQSRNGRWYLAGVDEAQTTGPAMNTITAGAQAGYNAALADFLAGVEDQGGQPQRTPVVVSAPPARPRRSPRSRP